ncbi:MAG: Unknown protein [uncultured Sulfurovum sp.]|uniref:Lipoprotein n=1 Tax=uncultured Sulfurovum sp. TaxID=269237 RepID=A0A6S6TN23_9BACT|nr:MAG: Unknown protein [uncultured Sulfurovum sp.]
MKIGSIITMGISLGTLLIFSCISLNASQFYSKVEIASSIKFNSKPEIVLRDRTSYKYTY